MLFFTLAVLLGLGLAVIVFCLTGSALIALGVVLGGCWVISLVFLALEASRWRTNRIAQAIDHLALVIKDAALANKKNP